MKSLIPSRIAFFALVLFAASACNRVSTPTAEETRPVPTAEDISLGRRAISLNEVSLLARSGLHQEALAAVQQRHVPEELSAEDELKLRGFAKPELLAALKDPKNILTPAQKDAYDEPGATDWRRPSRPRTRRLCRQTISDKWLPPKPNRLGPLPWPSNRKRNAAGA